MTLPGSQTNTNPIRRSYIVAAVIFFVLVAWVASGAFSSDPKGKPSAAEVARTEAAARAAAIAKPMVRVSTLKPEKRRQDHVIRGQTEALRKVIVRAETAGKVAVIRADRGTPVKSGDTICEIAVDEREAMLKQARAVMKQRKLEYDASRQLNEKGFRSETALAGDQAEYEAAVAQVERMEKQLDDTKILLTPPPLRRPLPPDALRHEPSLPACPLGGRSRGGHPRALQAHLARCPCRPCFDGRAAPCPP